MSISIHGQVRDESTGRGVPDVCVSNGETITRTDEDGRYVLHADPEAHRFIQITVPERFRPRETFFIPSTVWSAASDPVDFPLEPAPERARTSFVLAQITDTHVVEEERPGLSNTRWLTEDLRILIETSHPDLIVASGDLTNRGKSKELSAYLEAIRTSEVPLFSLFGGHDGNEERFAGPPGSTFTRNWEAQIGPTYYSLDWGGRHIVLYPTEDYFFSPEDQQHKARWLSADLRAQPQDREIILVVHTPPTLKFLDSLSPYNVRLILYGHWHSSKVFTHGNTVIAATPPLCFGGIDTMPRGFRTVTFDVDGNMRTDLVALKSQPVPGLLSSSTDPELLHCLWHRRLEASVHRAAPVIAGDDLLLSGIDEEHRGRQGVSCVDVRTGVPRWYVETDASIKNSVAVADIWCVAVSITGRIVAVQRTSGHVAWQADLPGYPERWVYTSPTIADDTVYVGARSGYGAYDLETGVQRWYAEIENTDAWSCYASPQIYKHLVIVLISRRGLLALDRTTGAIVWERELATEYQYPSPVVTGDLLVSGGDAGQLVLLHADSGEVVWKQPATEARYIAGLTVDGDRIYTAMPDGVVQSRDLSSGELHWQIALGEGLMDMTPYRRNTNAALAPPVVFGDRIVVPGCDGRLHLFDPDGASLGSVNLGSPVSAAPCVDGDRLYVGTYDGDLYAFGEA